METKCSMKHCSMKCVPNERLFHSLFTFYYLPVFFSLYVIFHAIWDVI